MLRIQNWGRCFNLFALDGGASKLERLSLNFFEGGRGQATQWGIVLRSTRVRFSLKLDWTKL
jgi:hypothetical protein